MVMLAGKIFAASAAARVMPDDFIDEIAENPVQHDAHAGREPPVAMGVQAAVIGQDIVNELESWINEFIEGAGIPLVLKGCLAQKFTIFPDRHIHAEIKTGLERRIYINQLHAAGIMNHVPQGAACEGGQDIKVVCANQGIRPAICQAAPLDAFHDSRADNGLWRIREKPFPVFPGEGQICLEQPDYFGLLRPGESLALHDL